MRAYARNVLRPRPTDAPCPALENAATAPTYEWIALGTQGLETRGRHMIDAEVARLRRLRNTALRARAVAAALDGGSARDSALSRSAASCWRIARVITGWLRAHPYLSYRRDPSELRRLYDRAGAGLLSAIARYRGRTHRAFSEELRRVARELDDARALTWSPDLSDSLGRSQMQIRRLIVEVDDRARNEGGIRDERGSRPAVQFETRTGTDAHDGQAGDVPGNWPYLAI